MKSIRIGQIGLLAIASSLVGCAGSMPVAKYPSLKDGGKLAVVSFSLTKAVNEETTLTKTEDDNGPGLLQKADNYYKDHQAALDTMWTRFTAKLPAVVGVEVVPVSVLQSSPSYLPLTKHVPKNFLGTDMAPGANQLIPAGFNWVNRTDSKVLDSVAKLSGASQLLLVENIGTYKMSSGAAIGGLGAGVAKMYVRSSMCLYRPGRGIVWSGSYSNASTETGAIIAGTMATSNYPVLLPQAFEANLEKFAADVQTGAQPVAATAK